MNIKKLRPFTLRVILPIAIILSIGTIYEQVVRIKTKKMYPPKGTMTQVGDENLHVNIKGNTTSLPTVVFESGYYPTGAGSLIWKKIQNEISKHTRTISYDRAGILWSGPTSMKPSTDAILKNLYGLLKKVDGDGPYILVAHSISGMTARAFTVKYPEMVCGMILVDASHPEANKKIPKEILGKRLPKNYAWISFLSTIGYIRFTNSYRYPATSKNDSINIISNALFPERILAIIKEKELRADWVEKLAEQTSFGNLPIKIIAANGDKIINEFPSRENGELYNDIWKKLQQDMLSLSNNSELILAEDSGHYIPLEQPNLVINTILDLSKEIIDNGSEKKIENVSAERAEPVDKLK